jgi:hypothetical protein
MSSTTPFYETLLVGDVLNQAALIGARLDGKQVQLVGRRVTQGAYLRKLRIEVECPGDVFT